MDVEILSATIGSILSKVKSWRQIKPQDGILYAQGSPKKMLTDITKPMKGTRVIVAKACCVLCYQIFLSYMIYPLLCLFQRSYKTKWPYICHSGTFVTSISVDTKPTFLSSKFMQNRYTVDINFELNS